MQIVIDIPEEILKQEVYTNVDLIQTIAPAVHNGTPIPKGHGRLIDADEVKELVKGWSTYAVDKALTLVEAENEV